MCRAVLMPGNRSPEPRRLNKQRLVEGHEVLAIDGGGNPQQPGVTVDAQTRLGELERAQDQVNDLFGRVRGGRGLEHLDGMAPVRERGAAKGIAEGFGPEERRRLAVGGERGPAVPIEGRTFFPWETL